MILVRKFHSLIFRVKCEVLKYTNQRLFANELYKKILNIQEGINWDNPIDINEKINWLKFCSDTSEWIRLADKYAVREFIKERVGDIHLVPLYGVWDNANDIDFATLPESFVLKTNNGAGSVILVKDKNKINLAKIRKKLNEWLKSNFGRDHAEPHYTSIKPLIIAEGLLVEENPVSNSLVDYKVWCFNGKVFGTWCCFNRIGFHADTEWHDIEWNFKPEWSIFTESYRNGGGKIKKPENYELMLQVASRLSEGFPEVRIDLYNIGGKIYFGEMTFTTAGGHINFYAKDILKKLGQMTDLSLARKLS